MPVCSTSGAYELPFSGKLWMILPTFLPEFILICGKPMYIVIPAHDKFISLIIRRLFA